MILSKQNYLINQEQFGKQPNIDLYNFFSSFTDSSADGTDSAVLLTSSSLGDW